MKFVFIILVALLLYYVLVFVLPKEVNKPKEVYISFIEGNKVSVELTDSYYYIQSCQFNYSENSDTLYLSIKKSTLANIFSNNKLGFKIIELPQEVNVISYCDTSINRIGN